MLQLINMFLYETHPWTAVKPYVGGTLAMLEFADKFSAEKFVLIY